jgi:4-hydroxy-2-oxoheptanedioate aldolase
MSRTLASRFAAGEQLLSGWITVPDPLIAATMIDAGFDAVMIDMQHGMMDLVAAIAQITAVRHAGGRVIARVPVAEGQTASKLLDAGADGVVAPMIETVEDARAFADYMKYPPLGQRSWGPTRSIQLARHDGATYPGPDAWRREANADTLAIVMIETRRALGAIDDILALPGIDGVFVGPGDLSIALSDGRTLDIEAPATIAAIEHAAARARAAGKIAGIFAASGKHARWHLSLGYQFVTPLSALDYMTLGIKGLINEARG